MFCTHTKYSQFFVHVKHKQQVCVIWRPCNYSRSF
jgi:hypothetical protein